MTTHKETLMNLPTDPTYGWLTWTQHVPVPDDQGEATAETEPADFRSFGVWQEDAQNADRWTNGHHSVHLEHITGFTPAVVSEAPNMAAAAADTHEVSAEV